MILPLLQRTSANVRPDNESHLRRCLEIKFTADIECTRDITGAAADTQQSHVKVVRFEAAEQTVDFKVGKHDFLHALGNVESRFCSSKRDWRHDLERRRDSENDVVGLDVDVFPFRCLESDEEPVGSGESFYEGSFINIGVFRRLQNKVGLLQLCVVFLNRQGPFDVLVPGDFESLVGLQV